MAVGRPLRLGYFGPDFRAHSVAFFLEPPLQGHNPEGFESTLYSLVDREDCVTVWLRKAASRRRDHSGLTEAEAAEGIRRDGFDILMDLAGHSSGQPLELTEAIAPDAATYEARAIALASDPAPLDGLRPGLPARMERSPLRDEAGFARSMDAAFRAALAAHYLDRPAAAFTVP